MFAELRLSIRQWYGHYIRGEDPELPPLPSNEYQISWRARIRRCVETLHKEARRGKLELHPAIQSLLCGAAQIRDVATVFEKLQQPQRPAYSHIEINSAAEVLPPNTGFTLYHLSRDDESRCREFIDAINCEIGLLEIRFVHLRLQGLEDTSESTHDVEPSDTESSPHPAAAHLPKIPHIDESDEPYLYPLLTQLLDLGAVSWSSRQKQGVVEHAAKSAGLGLRGDYGRDWSKLKELGLTDSSTGGSSGGVWLTNIGAAMAKWLKNR